MADGRTQVMRLMMEGKREQADSSHARNSGEYGVEFPRAVKIYLKRTQDYINSSTSHHQQNNSSPMYVYVCFARVSVFIL